MFHHILFVTQFDLHWDPKSFVSIVLILDDKGAEAKSLYW